MIILFVVLLNKQHADEMFKMISKCMQLKLTIDILICFYVQQLHHNSKYWNICNIQVPQHNDTQCFANKYYNLPHMSSNFGNF